MSKNIKAAGSKKKNSCCIPLYTIGGNDIVLPKDTDKIRYAYPWEYECKTIYKKYGRK